MTVLSVLLVVLPCKYLMMTVSNIQYVYTCTLHVLHLLLQKSENLFLNMLSSFDAVQYVSSHIAWVDEKA